jgi:exodeoxyribonuclease V alpha subunit
MAVREDPREAAGQELTGEVTAVVFANEATGFGVVELSGDGDADRARASGPLADLVPGQPVRLLGRWTEHERYGPTFAAVAYEHATPRSAKALVSFLASRRFPGVGETLAQRIVDEFGIEVGAVIERDPMALARVHGVSAALAGRIAAAWAEAGVLAVLVRRLADAGLPPALAQGAYRRFGERVVDVLEEDPYAILAVRGAGWPQAERLARVAGVAADDPRRLAAAPGAALRQVNAREGHMAAEGETLLPAVKRLLRLGDAAAAEAVERAATRGDIVRDHDLWYTPADLAAEQGLADEFARLIRARSRVRSAGRRYEPEADLTTEQVTAVRAALERPVSLLTGGPGTGKTRTVCELVRAADSADLRVALCAPTGRAAKRLEEVTGASATTIHRLLEARPTGGDGADAGFAFSYDRHRRLPFDLVVADEWSMADTRLAWALVQAVDDGAHLVCVGDPDQLPSVGSGAVLRDLLDHELTAGSGAPLAATRLTVVHRQAAASRIVTLAHDVNAGRVGDLRGRDGDVFVVPERPQGIASRVAEIVAVRAPAYFGCSPADVQVLAPMYRGPAGVDALNSALKERLNPAAGRPAVGGFHEGDRVVATRNDAEFDIANGDLGEVVAADPRERTLEVAFPHGVVELPGDRLDDLRPGWCLTVHKAQGGEWPVVVLALEASHRAMLWRELVYTAVSRAAAGLLLVGDATLVAAAAQRVEAGARRRRTRLVARLAAAAARPVHPRGALHPDGDTADDEHNGAVGAEREVTR